LEKSDRDDVRDNRMTRRVHRLGDHAGLPQMEGQRMHLAPKLSEAYRIKPDFPHTLFLQL